MTQSKPRSILIEKGLKLTLTDRLMLADDLLSSIDRGVGRIRHQVHGAGSAYGVQFLDGPRPCEALRDEDRPRDLRLWQLPDQK